MPPVPTAENPVGSRPRNAYFRRGLAYQEKGEKAKAEEDCAQAKRLGYKPGPSFSPRPPAG